MKALSWITNRHVVSALCAAPILLSCVYASAEDVVTAAPAEAAPPYTLTYNLGYILITSAVVMTGVMVLPCKEVLIGRTAVVST